MVLSDSIIILLIGTVGSLLGMACRLCFLSKCKVVKCCGVVQVERDTANEDNAGVTMGPPSPNRSSQRNISSI